VLPARVNPAPVNRLWIASEISEKLLLRRIARKKGATRCALFLLS
jgi:hypothetical protein